MEGLHIESIPMMKLIHRSVQLHRQSVQTYIENRPDDEPADLEFITEWNDLKLLEHHLEVTIKNAES